MEALGQVGNTTVVGRIQDSAGAVIAGARIEMRRISTNETQRPEDISRLGGPAQILQREQKVGHVQAVAAFRRHSTSSTTSAFERSLRWK